MNTIIERLGASLMRAPYVWLVATILLFLLMNTGLATIAEDTDTASTPLALVGAGLVVFAVIAWRLVPRLSVGGDRGAVLFLRWIFGLCPFLFAFCVVGAGAQQWLFSLGFVTSVVLLSIIVRDARRLQSEHA